MAIDDLLEAMLDRWEDLREQGHSIPPEEICRDHPELLDEFTRRIDELSTIDAFLNGDGPDPPVLGEARVDEPAGRYQPLYFHNKGGLGEIYVALDTELQRKVALKRIQELMAWHGESRRRFVLEAEITGKLEHPGIVPVYGFGFDDDGQPYYAMRFIRGDTLGEAIDAFHRADRAVRDPGERAVALQKLVRGFLTACQTIAYSHSRSVIHRDIKPANIMLGPYGETLVVDWGLAKPLDRDVEVELKGPIEDELGSISVSDLDRSTVGAVKGSPAYMSPEQAEGRWDIVGPTSDVYSLGATLYSLLTGQKPFDGKNVAEVLDKVIKGQFPRPRVVKPVVPRALEAVCLKAMSKERGARYQGALALAADLERWLSDEPVSAWKEPWRMRARRWVRRHRTFVTASGAALVAALVLLSVTAALLRERNQRLKEALDSAQANLYVRNIALADRVWTDGQVELAEQILDECPRAPRGWEWDYLKRRCRGDLLTRSIASGPVNVLAFLPDGKRFATVSKNVVAEWDTATGTQAHHFRGPREAIALPVFSADGRRVAGALEPDRSEVVVWETATGRVLDQIRLTGEGAESLAFNGDGTQLAVAAHEAGRSRGLDALPPALRPPQLVWITVRDLSGRQQRSRFSADGTGRLGRMTFSPDNRRLCLPELGILSSSVTVVDAGTGVPLGKYELTDGGRLQGELIELSPDLRAVAVPDEGFTIKVRDLANAATRVELRGHTDQVLDLRFSPDGQTLVSASADRSVRVWDLRTGRAVSILKGCGTLPEHVAMRPDGRTVVFAGGERSVLWEVAASSESRVLRIPESDPIAEVVFETDDRFATVADGRVTLREAASGGEQPLPAGGILCLAYRPDGRMIVAEESAGTITIVDGRGKTLGVLKGAENWGSNVEFSPGGRLFASAGPDNSVRLWESASGRQLRTLSGHSEGVTALAFTPDGTRLASGSTDRTVLVWDVASGRKLKTLQGLAHPVKCLAFHPDGNRLLSGGSEDEGGSIRQLGQAKVAGELAIWDTAAGARLFQLDGHAAGIFAASWSPDGRRLVSADSDGVLKLWETASGRELLTLRGPTSEVRRVAWSPDGRRIVSVGGMTNLIRALAVGELAIWDGRPLDPISRGDAKGAKGGK